MDDQNYETTDTCQLLGALHITLGSVVWVNDHTISTSISSYGLLILLTN